MEGYRLGPVLTDKVISVVKRVEDMPYRYGDASIPVRFEEDGGGGGGSVVRLCKTTAAWSKDTVITLDVWESGTTPNETISAGKTVVATNHQYPVAACVWVEVAKAENGTYYLMDAGTPDPVSGCAAPNIAGHDLTTVQGYASNKKQALTHDANACLKWVDIEDCA